MIDVQFLNQKATKLKSGLKNIRTILEKGEDTFLNTPMYPDRVKYYLIIVYDILEDISCHLLKEIYKKITKEGCLEEIVKTGIFSEKINRTLYDFVNLKKKLFHEEFNYSDRELYYLTKDILNTLDGLYITELAGIVKQMKEKAPKLKIPVNLVKINHNLSVMKAEVRRMKTFGSLSLNEFEKDAFAVDRVRYFLTVYIDSALWICRHVIRQAKLQNKRCFLALAENGNLTSKTAEFFQNLADRRDLLADPVKDIDMVWLWEVLKKIDSFTESMIKELSVSLVEKRQMG